MYVNVRESKRKDTTMAESREIQGTGIISEFAKRARPAASPEELATIAKEAGMELDVEEAQALLERLAANGGSKELADEELENVTGGCSVETGDGPTPILCKNCGSGDIRIEGHHMSGDTLYATVICNTCGHAEEMPA